MTGLNSQEMLKAIDDGLEVASRWPRLLTVLGFEPEEGRPGPLLLNNALQRIGYRRVLNENDSPVLLADHPFPDMWWQRIATEVTGNANAKVDDVIAALRRAPRAAAE